MPYFVTDSSPDCSGWATIKEDGEVIGCHENKQDAIDQMVVVSLAEEIEPGGERIKIKEQKRILPDNYRPSLSEDVPKGRACGNCIFYKEDDVKEFADGELRAWCEKWDDYVNGAYYCNAWQSAEEIEESPEEIMDDAEKEDDDYEERAINQEAPAYMRAAARRGLEYLNDGYGGDGLTDKTKREARLMADGQISDDKWIRIAAWIARHMPDLDAPQNNDPSDPQYPGPGLVAHLLWGSGPSKRAAQRTMNFAENVVERIRAEEEKNRWASVSLQLRKEKEEKMPALVERRINDVTFEIRNGEIDANKRTFTGYAAVFNSPSEPLPFTEFIMPGAFKRSLKSRNEIKMFMNHNMDIVLGSTRSKTLRLSEDSKGLLAETTLPDTTAGRDLSILMQRGDVNSMSFGFSVPARGDKWSDDGMTRELHQIRLHEVSIVTGFPAYEATTATVRSIDALATRTGMDADVLADALTKLEAGETLSMNHADVIGEAVAKLKESNPSPQDLLDIKRKQIDMLFKAI
jgi:HK97 family phage prohead protease